MTTTTPAIERGTEAVRRNADVAVLLRPLIARAVLAAAFDGPELDAETLARTAYEDWCKAHQLLPLWETAGKSEKRRWLLTAQALLATLHTAVLGKQA